MKVASLAEWLKSYGLERLTEIFEQNEVDLSTLRILTESDLKELGLPFGPRKRILHLLSDERAHHKVEEPGDHVGAPSGERRQLTVLFCDLVGSTKLATSTILKRFGASFAPTRRPARPASIVTKVMSLER
jgi:hypothetical protein